MARFIERDGVRFWYIDPGDEGPRVWVSTRFVTPAPGGADGAVHFPLRDAALARTERGTVVLRYAPGYITLDVMVRCGYRGTAHANFLTPIVDKVDFRVYCSPRGALGVGYRAFVTVKESDMPLRFTWERTGRLYGDAPNGITSVHADGTEVVSDGVVPDDVAAFM